MDTNGGTPGGYDFFAPPPTPAPAPVASPDQFATPGASADPPQPWSAAAGAPPGWSAPPGGRAGLPVWAKVLIGASALGLAVVVCAVVLPVAQNYRAMQIYRRTSVAIPSSADGFVHVTTPQAQLIESMALARDPVASAHGTRSVVGIYSDTTGRPAVVVYAAKPGAPDRGKDSAAITGFEKGLTAVSGGAITDLATVPSGPLGGTTRCGHATIDSLPVLACGSADAGAIVIAVFYDPTTSPATFAAVRSAVETRS